MKIKVVGKHNRRDGSRFYKSFELMKTAGTVHNYFAKKGMRLALRAAVFEDNYAKVA
jgi:hypothetical protein